MRACEWLVISSRVENRVRKTSMQIQVPKQEDWLYSRGKESDRCILVLQGRLTALAGREQFRAEIGAFSVVGREALTSGLYTADFDAWLSTESTRLLVLKKELFQKAQELDKDAGALERAMANLNKGSLDKTEPAQSKSSLSLARSLACAPHLAGCRGGVHTKGV
jgi:CRP-like cAMP-binding protein